MEKLYMCIFKYLFDILHGYEDTFCFQNELIKKLSNIEGDDLDVKYFLTALEKSMDLNDFDCISDPGIVIFHAYLTE